MGLTSPQLECITHTTRIDRHTLIDTQTTVIPLMDQLGLYFTSEREGGQPTGRLQGERDRGLMRGGDTAAGVLRQQQSGMT